MKLPHTALVGPFGALRYHVFSARKTRKMQSKCYTAMKHQHTLRVIFKKKPLLHYCFHCAFAVFRIFIPKTIYVCFIYLYTYIYYM